MGVDDEDEVEEDDAVGKGESDGRLLSLGC